MKTEPPCALACSILFVLIAVPLLDSQQQQSDIWSAADWQWLNENFHVALEHSLPLEKGRDVVVSYRSYETLQVGDPEYSLSIFWRRSGSCTALSAHIRVPDGKPIGEQMLLFHRKHALGPVGEAEKALMFKDWELTEQKCPSLKASIQKLEQIRFGLTSDTIYMDPTVHEFYLSSSSGNVDAALVDHENPLVQWGLNTRQAVQACVASNLPSTKSPDASRK